MWMYETGSVDIFFVYTLSMCVFSLLCCIRSGISNIASSQSVDQT